MTSIPLLSLVIFLPWLGALALAALPRANPLTVRGLALLFSLSTLALGLLVWANFDASTPGWQLVEQHRWISFLHVSYHVGLDGMSLLLVLLTGLVAPAALLASWRIERDSRLFCLLFLSCRARRSACSSRWISSRGSSSGS